MNRALFLDRDGVINEDYGYVHKIEDFHFREGIFDVCRAALKARMKIIVVTNQAGIGRGFYTEQDYLKVTEYMSLELNWRLIAISGVYHCPYHPEHGVGHYKADSDCRKPRAGMLIRASRDHDINLSHSVMIGDKDSDRASAEAAGLKIYLDANRLNWKDESINAIDYL